MPPTVSFIIPSYNSRKTIERTLLSIEAQSAHAKIAEVIVVDSSDDLVTKQYLMTAQISKLLVISLREKTNPAQGRNAGAKQATGDVLCFVDSDVFLADDWLAEVLAAYARGYLVGCGSVSAPDFQSKDMLSLAQLYLQFNESLRSGKTREIKLVPACNMFCERELFVRVGTFPNMRASEDVMFCLNVAKETKIWFVPSAQCFHIFRESLQAYFGNQIVLGKYIIAYRRAYYQKWYYQGLWPLVFLPAFVLIKLGMIKLRILKAGPKHFFKFLMSLPLFLVGLYYWAVGFAQGSHERGDA